MNFLGVWVGAVALEGGAAAAFVCSGHTWCHDAGTFDAAVLEVHSCCTLDATLLEVHLRLGKIWGEDSDKVDHYTHKSCAHTALLLFQLVFYGWFNNGVYLQNVFLTKLIGVAVINHRICGCPILRQNHMVRLTMFHLCPRLNLEHGTGTILSPWTLNRTTTAKAARRFKIWTNTSRISIPSVTWLL